jgi:hypothetical protein
MTLSRKVLWESKREGRDLSLTGFWPSLELVADKGGRVLHQLKLSTFGYGLRKLDPTTIFRLIICISILNLPKVR